MNRISVKAVVVGGITDIVATVILPLPLIVYLIATEVTGTSKEPLQAAVMTAIRANPLLYGLESLISLACSVLGGYVAARVAKRDELLNGSLASFLPVTLGVYSLATSKDSGPLLLPVLLLIASPLCSRLGGHLRLVQIRGSAAHPQFQCASRREDEILERARDALQKVGNGFVDAKQIEALRAALYLQAADGDRHKFRRRAALGTTPRVFLWSIVLKAFFWIIALIVIAAVVSNTGIDLFDLSNKLAGH
jgi:ABC-type antimicrobial peptide transport system permease subunit